MHPAKMPKLAMVAMVEIGRLSFRENTVLRGAGLIRRYHQSARTENHSQSQTANG
jgi:hypothetical protein